MRHKIVTYRNRFARQILFKFDCGSRPCGHSQGDIVQYPSVWKVFPFLEVPSCGSRYIPLSFCLWLAWSVTDVIHASITVVSDSFGRYWHLYSSTFLTAISNLYTLVYRREHLTRSQTMQKRWWNQPEINLKFWSEMREMYSSILQLFDFLELNIERAQ